MTASKINLYLFCILGMVVVCSCSADVGIIEAFEMEEAEIEEDIFKFRQDIYEQGSSHPAGDGHHAQKIKHAIEDFRKNAGPNETVVDDEKSLKQLLPGEEDEKRKKRKIRLDVVQGGRYWPRSLIPYYIDYDTYSSYAGRVRVRQAVEDGIRRVENVSCVKFVERSNLTKSQKDLIGHNHAVRIFNGQACWSYSGCTKCHDGVSGTPTTQVMSLDERICLRSEIVQHEFGHVLGLTHEHTRTDRNRFIAINYTNVKDVTVFYKKIHPQFINIAPYDLSSIQHYQDVALTTENPELGWLKYGIGGLSHYDEWSINQAYCRDKCVDKCSHDGFVVRKNGRCVCKCPQGLTGDHCESSDSVKKYDCGGMIFLLPGKSTTIRTPQSSSTYKIGVRCTWIVKSTPNTVIETEILQLGLTSTRDSCKHYIEVRDNLLAQVSRMKCGDCSSVSPCYKSTSSTNRALIVFDALNPARADGFGARIKLTSRPGCDHCKGAPCTDGSCYPYKGEFSCNFDHGLIDECSRIKLHDSYEKPYTDYTWTEAAWEISDRVDAMPGTQNKVLHSYGGRLHLQSLRPYPHTPGPFEGVFRILPHYFKQSSTRCLKFALFNCCDGTSTLSIYVAVDGTLNREPVYRTTETEPRWRNINVLIHSVYNPSKLIEIVFKAHHTNSNQKENHMGIDSIQLTNAAC